MLKSFSNYITFTDVDGDFVVIRKSAITDFCVDGNVINIGIGDSCYDLPKSEFTCVDDVIDKIFY